MWNKDHASWLLTVIMGGHCTLLHEDDFCYKNLILWNFNNNVQIIFNFANNQQFLQKSSNPIHILWCKNCIISPPKCQKIHIKLGPKLVKLTCLKFICIFVTFHGSHDTNFLAVSCQIVTFVFTMVGQFLLWASCVVSKGGIWFSSATERSYKELFKWASCSQWGHYRNSWCIRTTKYPVIFKRYNIWFL